MLEGFASITDLGAFNNKERSSFESDNIYYNKMINNTLNTARKNARLNNCYFCGKETEGFCNSHSVPAFCLKNIDKDGYIMLINSLINVPVLKKESGVKNAGTFKLICRDCDSKIFSDYENPNNYCCPPTPKMLAQIALKNNLKSISKRKVEIELYNILKCQYPPIAEICKQKNLINNMDLQAYINDFNKAKKAIEQNLESNYYLCFFEKLDYVVPIAFQSQIALAFDFNGNVINDIYDKASTNKVTEINLSIFPLENSSVIFGFIEDGDKKYRPFYKQFNKLPLDEKLLSLTFIIFAYSEEIFISKSIENDIKDSEELCKISRIGVDLLSSFQFFDPLQTAKKAYNLSNRKKIPNLLSAKYKLR